MISVNFIGDIETVLIDFTYKPNQCVPRITVCSIELYTIALYHIHPREISLYNVKEKPYIDSFDGFIGSKTIKQGRSAKTKFVVCQQ